MQQRDGSDDSACLLVGVVGASMPRPYHHGDCVLPAGHDGDCVGGDIMPVKHSGMSTPWVMKSYSSFGVDSQRTKPPTLPMGQRSDREVQMVRSGKNPELQGFSFKLDDIYGSPSAKMQTHQPWRRRGPGDEFEDWTKRPGYGFSPAYLDEQQQLRPTSSVGSLRPVNSVQTVGARSGASRLTRSGVSRSGSASHLSVGRSAGGLLVSNATVRLIEHPLAWRLHQNGINVKTPYAKQPAGSASVLRQPTLADAADPLSSASMVDMVEGMPLASRPLTPSALCATFGLHPAFPRGRRPVAVG